jgi:hypothetical protein
VDPADLDVGEEEQPSAIGVAVPLVEVRQLRQIDAGEEREWLPGAV